MKKLLGCILFILCSSIISVGQTSEHDQKSLIDSLTTLNKKMHDYVMRVQLLYFINDFENVFTSKEYESLDTLALAIDKESPIEIGVITIDTLLVNIWDSAQHKRLSFDSLTLLLARKWVDRKKNEDNGILIGFSKEMRRIRIQNGVGIEKRISDSETKDILDSLILPQFKKGNYYEGIREGILALYRKLNPTTTIH
jgi:uncharacterized protein